MRDRPIIFSAPMIRAIIREIEHPGTGKTMTRRIIKGDYSELALKVLPYEVGMLLWVRENWWHDKEGGDQCNEYGYLADDNYPAHGENDGHVRHRPSIHMPRWASRITLEVTAVKVERLQDISEEDAKAEGAGNNHAMKWWPSGDPGAIHDVYRRNFSGIWFTIHGADAWKDNPWVVAVAFTPHLRNIETLIKERQAA